MRGGELGVLAGPREGNWAERKGVEGGASYQAEGEGKRGDLGLREEGFVFIIVFSFLLFQNLFQDKLKTIFKTILKITLNYF